MESRSCPNILLCLTCVESMVVIVHGKNKRCGGETVYTWWCSCPSNLERRLNFSKHIGAKRWWTPLIALSLTIHELHVFGFTIANLVSNQPTLLFCQDPWVCECSMNYSIGFKPIKLTHCHHMQCACPCKLVDGGILLSATLKSWYTK